VVEIQVDGNGTARLALPDAPSEAFLRELLDEVRASGATRVVVETSHGAGEAWIRAGFTETARVLEAPLEVLERHATAEAKPSYGSIHVQSDDLEAVIRAVEGMVPRLPGNSRGTVIFPPSNGWISVFDELGDREPEMLRRLATEVADRMGTVVLLVGVEEERVLRFVLFERGRIMDEYLSVPEYYGPVPPGEVIALGANPRVVNRLTGADATRIRDIARTADRPEELPPPSEVLDQLARALAIESATERYATAAAREGAIVLARRDG